MALLIIPVLKRWSRARDPYGNLQTWNWPITACEVGQPYNKEQYVIAASFPKRGCVIYVLSHLKHRGALFWTFVELLSLIFFIFFCGNVAFTVSKLIDGRLLQTTNTNIANKVKWRVKIKNQDRRRVASICLQVQAVDRLLDFAVASRVPLDDW